MIVIGARPSVGKSAYMGQMALAIARTGKKVGIISLEMNNNEIGARLSSLGSDDDFRTIFRNLYRDENHKALWYQKIQDLIELPIFITDKTDVSAASIKAKAIKLMHSEGLDILMIDYLQLVNTESDKKNRTRENEVSQLSRACKLLAKDLNIPVIVLCQLNRAITGRTGVNRYPQLSDLRESGSIEQDADVVMFIHRDWMLGEGFSVDENGNSTEFNADLVVRKWRNGAANLHIKLGFQPKKMMFYEPSEDRVNYWKPETDNFQNDNPF
jgi:replicative DNA helicase